jgi:hypothetical protein
MGYLDHSTNNIILDAVLTDYGRSKLASAGTAATGFNISKFAFGDDEVDYTIIKKYGRTVGKEKIEKNTPIFEALTNETIALKYKLIGLSTSGASLQTTALPVLSFDKSSYDLTSTSAASKETAVNITLKYKGSVASDTDLTAVFGSSVKTYRIKMSNRFLSLRGSNNPVVGDDVNRTATYSYTAGSNTFNISLVAQSIDSTTLKIYGQKVSDNQYKITTYVTVESLEIPSISKTFPVTYTASP